MKKKFKVLLVMLGLIMPFMVSNVYAEETATNSSETTTDEATKVMALSELKELLQKNKYNLDIKESEAFEKYEWGYNYSKMDDILNNELSKFFTENNLTFPLEIEDNGNHYILTSIKAYFNSENIREANFYSKLECTEQEKNNKTCYESEFFQEMRQIENEIDQIGNSITYSNTNEYNEETAKYVENKLNSISSKILYGENIDTYDADLDNEIIKKEFDNLQRALNDDSITLMFVHEGGGAGVDGASIAGPLIAVKDNIVYAYKVFSMGKCLKVIVPDNINDTDEAYIAYALPKLKEYFSKIDASHVAEQIVKLEKISSDNNDYASYVSKNLYSIVYNDGNSNPIFLQKENAVKVTDNVTIEENSEVTLSGTQITKEDKIYTDLAGTMASKGYTNVFGAYELKIEEGTIGENGLTLTFNVGEENNRKKAFVLHQKHDGTIEEFTGIVENGKIKVTVSELSPFMVALGDIVEEESTPATNNADTGTTNILLCGVVALSTMGGMVYLKKNKQK